MTNLFLRHSRILDTAEGQRLVDVDCLFIFQVVFYRKKDGYIYNLTEVTDDQSYDLKKPQQLLVKVIKGSFAGDNMKLYI